MGVHSANGVGAVEAEFGTDVLVAIRREHAERIFTGKKRYELRRVLPKCAPRRIYLWVTGNSGGVVGYGVVKRIVYGDPASLWSRIGKHATSKERYFHYFAGESIAYAFEIESSVRYDTPLTLPEIRKSWTQASVPRNFIYLDPEGPLSRTLEAKSFDAVIAKFNGNGPVSLRPITKKEHEEFRRAVVEHIGSAYLETGSTYAEHLIEANDVGFDAEGVFTRFKRICAIEHEDTLIGFVVLTGKLGGSVKSGPTMIDVDKRNQGLGTELRSVIHRGMAKLGYRKVYCTVPASRPRAMQYLLGAGYRIEADLDRQYHHGHREVVLGYQIADKLPGSSRWLRQDGEYQSVQRVQLVHSAEACTEFLRDGFSEMYCTVSTTWASRQLRKATRRKQSPSIYSKPLWAYRADDEDGVAAFVLCVWKRGGAVKLCPIVERGSDGSIYRMLKYAIDGIARQRSISVRKLYTHVGLEDEQLVRVFKILDFEVEGCLHRPYRNDRDVLAMGIMVRV